MFLHNYQPYLYHQSRIQLSFSWTEKQIYKKNIVFTFQLIYDFTEIANGTCSCPDFHIDVCHDDWLQCSYQRSALILEKDVRTRRVVSLAWKIKSSKTPKGDVKLTGVGFENSFLVYNHWPKFYRWVPKEQFWTRKGLFYVKRLLFSCCAGIEALTKRQKVLTEIQRSWFSKSKNCQTNCCTFLSSFQSTAFYDGRRKNQILRLCSLSWNQNANY